jgi:nucleoside-diphosphate-sugar epimerase
MSQRVLLTGHNGYIGSVMAPYLQARGHVVVGLDTGYFRGCTLGPEEDGFPCIWKDIRDVDEDCLKRFDAVIHLAALSNDPMGDLDPALTAEINHAASVKLAILAKAAGVKRFLYSSSCSMYGAAGDGFATEESPLYPLTPYAESKVKTEEDLVKLADKDFSPVYLRNATVYGFSPRLRADIVLNNMVCWAHTTGTVKILSDGTPWRPIAHVIDIANAFAAALEAPKEAIHNEAFNVGTNRENYQVKDIAEIVRQTVPGCTVEIAGKNNPDPRDYRVDFTKIANQLPGFTPKWTAEMGANELYDAYKKHGMDFDTFDSRRFTRLKQLKHLLETEDLRADLRWKRGFGEFEKEVKPWAA